MPLKDQWYLFPLGESEHIEEVILNTEYKIKFLLLSTEITVFLSHWVHLQNLGSYRDKY